MFMQRSMGYIAIINSVMLIFLLVSKLEVYGWNIDMRYWLIPIIFLLIFILILIGWIEDKAGLFRSEAYSTVQRNPYVTEMLDILRRWEKKEVKVEGYTKHIENLEKKGIDKIKGMEKKEDDS